MSRLIGVYGAVRFVHGTMQLLRAQYPTTELIFIDDGQAPDYVEGYDILTWTDFLDRQAEEKAVSILYSRFTYPPKPRGKMRRCEHPFDRRTRHFCGKDG